MDIIREAAETIAQTDDPSNMVSALQTLQCHLELSPSDQVTFMQDRGDTSAEVVITTLMDRRLPNKVRLAALKVVRCLTKSDDGFRWLIRGPGLKAVTEVLTEPDMEGEAHNDCVIILLSLSVARNNEPAMIKAGAVDALLVIAKTEYSTDAGTLAMKALMNISSNEDVRNTLVKNKGVEVLLLVASESEGEPQMQALKNLMNLAASMDLKVPMVERGVVPKMLSVVKRHPGEEVQLMALKVLMNIVSHKDTKMHMVNGGVVETMLALCSQKSTPVEHQLQCVKVLMSMATHRDTKVPMVQRGAVDTIIPLVSRGNNGEAGEELVLESVKSLMNLSSHMDTKRVVIERGAVEVLIPVGGADQALTELQLNVLKTLASLSVGDGLEAELCNRGALKVLLPVVSEERYRGTEHALQALNAIMNLSAASDEVKKYLVQLGCCEALASSARGVVVEHQVQAVKALMNLCAGKDVGGLLVQRGVGASLAHFARATGGDVNSQRLKGFAVKALSYLCASEADVREQMVYNGIGDVLLAVVVEEHLPSSEMKIEALRGLMQLCSVQQGRISLVQENGMNIVARALRDNKGIRELEEAALMVLWQMSTKHEGQKWFSEQASGGELESALLAISKSGQYSEDMQLRSKKILEGFQDLGGPKPGANAAPGDLQPALSPEAPRQSQGHTVDSALGQHAAVPKQEPWCSGIPEVYDKHNDAMNHAIHSAGPGQARVQDIFSDYTSQGQHYGEKSEGNYTALAVSGRTLNSAGGQGNFSQGQDAAKRQEPYGGGTASFEMNDLVQRCAGTQGHFSEGTYTDQVGFVSPSQGQYAAPSQVERYAEGGYSDYPNQVQFAAPSQRQYGVPSQGQNNYATEGYSDYPAQGQFAAAQGQYASPKQHLYDRRQESYEYSAQQHTALMSGQYGDYPAQTHYASPGQQIQPYSHAYYGNSSRGQFSGQSTAASIEASAALENLRLSERQEAHGYNTGCWSGRPGNGIGGTY